MIDITSRTIFPILFLILLGYISRKAGVLKQGDEKVLSAYVYYFALPAFFIINIWEIKFSFEVGRFTAAAVLPTFLVLAVYILLSYIFRIKKETLYKFILSTIFGSYAFFGIPFIMFAFPGKEGEALAALSSSSISIFSVIISITILEFFKHGGKKMLPALNKVSLSLLKNPLIISVVAGSLLSLSTITAPVFVASSLHLIGKTTSAVAIFMLGVFLYGRTYKNIPEAFGLSLFRIILLPLIAILSVSLFGIKGMQAQVIVLMSAMPVAISSIVLSERYDFYKETVASLILISSIGSMLYLPVWLIILGVK